MKSLIAKLEAATGPSRELDALIECEYRKMEAYALGLNDKQRSHWKPIGAKGEVVDDQRIARYHSLMYTFNTDAALSLVDNKWWQIEPGCDGSFFAKVAPWDQHVDSIASTKGATPAIALCIAALRARDGGRG